MRPIRIVAAYVVALVVFLAMDAVWLTLTGGYYRAVLGDMLAADVRLAPAVAFYLVDTLGLMIFVMWSGSRSGWGEVLGRGALFGVFTYATYDLTNYAVLRRWTLGITLADILWGAVLSAVVSLVGWAVLWAGWPGNADVPRGR
jgi:uncharacterized membrane protein